MAIFHRYNVISRQPVTVAPPRVDEEFCLFRDASHSYWEVIVKQVPSKDVEPKTERESHERLAVLSESFTRSQVNWTVIEKSPSLLSMQRISSAII